MPRQRSLVTVIRDMVQQEVQSAIHSLLGSVASTKPKTRNGRRRKRDASEQRVDRGLHFLLTHVPDDRHEASLSRHRVLRAGARYTKARSPAKSAAQRPEW